MPLFHVHPEMEAHHGESGHIHGGTIHTIFSGDLEGEYDGHTHDTLLSPLPLLEHVWDEHPEVGFSLLNDSTDRKQLKLPSATPLTLVGEILPLPEPVGWAAREALPPPPTVPSAREYPPRAPPASSL